MPDCPGHLVTRSRFDHWSFHDVGLFRSVSVIRTSLGSVTISLAVSFPCEPPLTIHDRADQAVVLMVSPLLYAVFQ
jgi:hypothetical protein